MKILIRLPNWLGDVVMSTAFVAAVRQLYTDAVIDIIVKKELAGLAAMIPGINTIHSFSKQEFEGLAGAYTFGKRLRTHQYDVFFNLPSSISSATLGWATQAKKRVGFGSEGSFFLLTKVCRRPKNIHRVDEYISLLEQFSGTAIQNREVQLSTPYQDVYDARLVIINFNSEASSRRMPADKAKHLLGVLIAAFADVQFALIGSPKDKVFIDELISNFNNDRLLNYAGKTDLQQLTALMSLAKVVLTTDSGPAHLANSLNIPVVVLFGAGNEHNTAPYNRHNLTVQRAGQLSCEPCLRNVCKLYGIPKCMELLDETRIINALSIYLNHA